MSSRSDDDYDASADAFASYYAAVEAKRLRGDTHWPEPLPPAWRVITPAPRTAALALASPRARTRRGVLAQVRNADSLAIYRGPDPVALAMFGRHGWQRIEMALAISAEAAPHMRRLIRVARLTLPRLAETRLVVAFVHPANVAGRRMAMLAGFRPARLKTPGYWVYRGDRRDGSVVRGQRCGGQSETAAADRQ